MPIDASKVVWDDQIDPKKVEWDEAPKPLVLPEVEVEGLTGEKIGKSLAYSTMMNIKPETAFQIDEELDRAVEVTKFSKPLSGAGGGFDPDAPRGVLAEIDAAIGAGEYGTIENYLRAARVFGLDTTDKLKTIQAMSEDFLPSRHGTVWDSINGGFTSTVESVMAGIPGMGIGLLAGTAVGGPPGAAIGAIAGFAGGAGGLFTLAEYDRFMEEVEEFGLKREDFKKEAIISAVAEGGIEALTDVIGLKIFGFIGKGVTEPVKQGLIAAFGRFLTRAGKLGSVEIPGEMVTAAIQAHERQVAGIPTPTPWEAAKASIGPSAVQTLLMGGAASAVRSMTIDGEEQDVVQRDEEGFEPVEEPVSVSDDETVAPALPATKKVPAQKFFAWVKSKGGIWDESLAGEMRAFSTRESRQVALLRKKTGQTFDELTQHAIAEGFLPEGSTTNDFIELARRAASGQEVVSLQDAEAPEDEGLGFDDEDRELADQGFVEKKEVVGVELDVGDEVIVDDERMRVVGKDDDGVTIQDGRRFRLDDFEKLETDWVRKAGEGQPTQESLPLKAAPKPKAPTPQDLDIREAAKVANKKAAQKVTTKDPVPDLEEAFEAQKDVWIGNKDWRKVVTEVEKKELQTDIKAAVGLKKFTKKAKDIDEAIQLNIDLKADPSHIELYHKEQTDEDRKILELSQNLPEDAKRVAERIEKSYDEIGVEALDADIIANFIENFANRVWDLDSKTAQEKFRKFSTKTRHAKQRVFKTILQGKAAGFKLKVKGATSNLQIYKEEIIKTIEDKRFMKSLRKVKDVEGNPLLTFESDRPGYVKVEHSNFTDYKDAGKAKPGEVYGKNFFVTDKGRLLEKRELYAPKAQADNLNNILGISKLKGSLKVGDVSVTDAVTKYNAITKAWILQTSLFHHLAFSRSYFAGVQNKRFGELNPVEAYKLGLKKIENQEPEIELGVRNGLTFALNQDWEEDLLKEKTIIGAMIDKMGPDLRNAKDKILKLREAQAGFLFGEFGAGLKAQAFVIELRNQVAEHPNEDINVVAKRVASLINNDFGGLHLQRLGRNPTTQHLFRLVALAPDWTESNVRTMYKAIVTGDKAERQLYRTFWKGVLWKMGAATVLANFAMAGGDWEELVKNYKRMWGEGTEWQNLKWTGIDITPVYRAIYESLGLDPGTDRKIFSLLGHFKDPPKFILAPFKSAHHKGSVLFGTVFEFFAGTDWKGERFTTVEELLNDGKTVKWGPGGPISWAQLPSYLISQIIGIQPIQIQNMFAWMAGEIEGFNGIANSLGLSVTNVRKKKKKGKRFKGKRAGR